MRTLKSMGRAVHVHHRLRLADLAVAVLASLLALANRQALANQVVLANLAHLLSLALHRPQPRKNRRLGRRKFPIWPALISRNHQR